MKKLIILMSIIVGCSKETPNPSGNSQIFTPVKIVLTASYCQDSINYMIINGAFSNGSISGFTKTKTTTWQFSTSLPSTLSYDFYPYPTTTDTLKLDIYVNNVLKYSFNNKNDSIGPGILSPIQGLNL